VLFVVQKKKIIPFVLTELTTKFTKFTKFKKQNLFNNISLYSLWFKKRR